MGYLKILLQFKCVALILERSFVFEVYSGKLCHIKWDTCGDIELTYGGNNI